MTKKNRTSSEFNEKSEYHSILERLPFPYHSLDTGGRILTVNDAWLNSLGYKRDDVLGEKITKFMDEESRPEFEEHFTLFTQHTGTFRGQVELINKNGVPIQFLVDGILETAQGDEPTRTHCFLRDISSTHNAESELQRLSARNSAILGAVPEILMEVDANRFYTWANQAGFDFFGTDVLGRKADVFFIEELKEEITSQVAPLLKGAVESLNILSWQRRCDGEKRLLSWCCRPLRDENGKVSGALSSARDITNAHEQNERIKRLNSILKGIRDINQLINQEVDVAPLLEGACDKLVGPFGFVSSWVILFEPGTQTPQHASLSGLGTSDLSSFKQKMLSGKLTDCAKLCVSSRDFVVIDEREQCSNCVLRKFHWKNNRLEHGTLALPLIVKNNLTGVFAASLPLSNVKDTEVTMLFREVVRDITKAIEKILNEKELEVFRLERIKNGKLESLGVMAGGIAHDFNNILVGILGNISLAKLDVQSDKHLLTYLDSAENAARKARELTHRLLTFSKGGTPIKSPISISKIINESVQFLFPDSSIKITVSTPENLKMILGEPSQIQQVLNNLLLNATEALKNSENPEISIVCENVELKDGDHHMLSGGKYVRVEVVDNGKGIPKDAVEKIFDPYFTTKHGGNGLGLSSVFSIAKAHDGIANLKTTSPTGSTFSILIPAVCDAPPLFDKNGSFGATTHEPRWQDIKILVMDDEGIVRGVLAEYISNFGWKSNEVVDGESAVKKYKTTLDSDHPFDIVILDLKVPNGMGGVEAAKRILKMNPDARVIVSSGYSEDDAIANFADYGFTAALRKPYAIEELYDTLASVLSNTR